MRAPPRRSARAWIASSARGALAVAIAMGLAGGAAAAAPSDAWTKASPHVRQAAGEGVAAIDVLLRVRGDAGLALLGPQLDHRQRVSSAVRSLSSNAEVSQRGIRAELEHAAIPHRAYWVANVIAARVTPAQLERLLARDDVVGVESDRPFRSALPLPDRDLPPAAPAAVEWNVARIRADQAWALGFRGQGVVVAGADTGYEWDHPALRAKYRGWNGSSASHARHWHDAIHALLGGGANPCGIDAPAPCDDNNHGTHTLGTMVGDDGGANQIGVAPDARWIACRNMERGVGRPSQYIECFQWFLAPTDASGGDPDPALAPQVINNSWGCPVGPPPNGEDCAVDSIRETVENVRAAGIFVVVAAGNSGSSCATITDPPAIHAASFTVGSTTSTDAVSAFSSRGPVGVDGSQRLKPDLAAPGSGVRSSVRNDGYANFSGTSMAAPAVSGVVALMMSADPSLKGDPDRVEALLEQTAMPLTHTQNCAPYVGAVVPNTTFGHGRVDALAAVQAALAGRPDAVFRDDYE